MRNRISSADDTPRVVTAADLRTGRVVYLDGSGQWTGDFRLAQVARTAVGQRGLLRVAEQAEDDNLVLGPALAAVDETGARVVPVHIRERIRAAGPTVGPAAAWAVDADPAMLVAAE